jgi:predicted transcriptional regulator of viral defense system
MGQLTRLGALIASGRIWRMSALLDEGITAATVRRALTAGMVEQVSRGTYRLAGAPREDGMNLAEALARIPRGLVCLLSAAQVHNLGDELSRQVWVAIPNSDHTPKLDWPPVKVIRWTNPHAFSVGVEAREICGVEVRITSPARTVVDMLRMTRAVGEEVALKCLGDALQTSVTSLPELTLIAAELGAAKQVSAYLRIAGMLGRQG